MKYEVSWIFLCFSFRSLILTYLQMTKDSDWIKQILDSNLTKCYQTPTSNGFRVEWWSPLEVSPSLLYLHYKYAPFPHNIYGYVWNGGQRVERQTQREQRDSWEADVIYRWMTASMVNASRWLSFWSAAYVRSSMLIKDMAWSDNYPRSLWSCLQERKITFATDALRLFLRTHYLFSNMAAEQVARDQS